MMRPQTASSDSRASPLLRNVFRLPPQKAALARAVVPVVSTPEAEQEMEEVRGIQ